MQSFQINASDDFYAISEDIPTKSLSEIKDYMTVFLDRYTELPIRNTVFTKLRYEQFQKQNEETFLKFENYKDYQILL